jgi:hypothetical protein
MAEKESRDRRSASRKGAQTRERDRQTRAELKSEYRAALRKEDTPQRAKWREYNRRRSERKRRGRETLAARLEAVRAAQSIELPEQCRRCRIDCDIVSPECRLKEADVYRLRPDLILDLELMERLEVEEVGEVGEVWEVEEVEEVEEI